MMRSVAYVQSSGTKSGCRLHSPSISSPLHAVLTRFPRLPSSSIRKNIQLFIEFGDSLKVLGVTNIVCDKVRFGQVVTNLLSNAIKFTDVGALYDSSVSSFILIYL